MKFTGPIKPYSISDQYTLWISGIYKIVSYRKGEYLAFFIQEWFNNWGDYVSPPPHDGKFNKCWKTLTAAKQACKDHARGYKPSVKTVKRAAALLDHILDGNTIG